MATFSGVHHLALSTNDMKSQIEFFTQAVGMPLVALFPMHGADGASHCFLKAGEHSYLSFIQMEGVSIDPVIGVSHARDAVGPVAGGAMQHVAFNVDTMAELLDLRDRLRSAGYIVFGPLDHGSSMSMYLGAPEGILLEFSTDEGFAAMDPEHLVKAETGALMGMSEADLSRYVSPPVISGRGGDVPQPDSETAVYPTPIPRPMFDALGHLSDDDLRKAVSFAEPDAQPAH